MAKAHELTDNFNDNSTNLAKWLAYGNPAPQLERIREVNGRVEIRPQSSSSLTATGYISQTSYDLTDSYAHVELVQALPGRPGVYAFLMVVEANSTNRLFFSIENGSLICAAVVSGAYERKATVPYDPLQHRWLRLREQLGTTFWETSRDGHDWNVLVSAPNPITLTAVLLAIEVDMDPLVVSPGLAVFDNFNTPNTSLSRRTEERRLSARDVRVEAADLAAERLHTEHVNNNDEVNYPGRPFIGNYSKSLKHDSLGDPEPISYGSLLRALQSEDPGDFEEIELASTTAVKLTNPQSGLTFEIGGPDAQEVTQIPAPRFDSEQAAHEMGELYWMALARDLHFSNWATQAGTAGTVIQRAINSLNNEFPGFGGSRPVTVQNLFRGIFPGEQVGPYVSQFLLKGNVDQRKPDGQGRDANEGFISYGSQTIDQRNTVAQAGLNYLTSFSTWLEVQNGVDKRGQDQFDPARRFIRNLRDGATYVHFDQVLNAFYNAAWILMTEPTGNQLTFVSGTTGRPQIDLEFPKDQGDPYDPPGTAMDSRTQVGFATFGPTHLLQVLGEVLGRALRAVWWQKWGVHRRLRPEEYGGRVHNNVVSLNTSGASGRTYPLNTSILTSLRTGLLGNYFNATSGYLLPQAYPEGAPTHPAYGAGHATGSGACATILKAFFDESAPIENPVQAATDGLSLVSYAGADATQMTVGGELNKLAGNISLFRNAAGVHWRSDHTESLLLGESIAIRLLQEMSLGFNEKDAFFELTRFDGQKIRVFDGKVVAVV